MPGYGLAEAQGGKGLLPWSWAEAFLSKGKNYWLATTRPDGRPHLMPVWGLWREERFEFSTGMQSRKARNLAREPRCTVGLEHELEAVVVEGTAELITDAETIRTFAELYAQKYDYDMTGFDEPIFVVRPKVVIGFTAGLEETATRWRFEA
jgi:PPOX class probable F420-dependent enzyme